MIGLTKLVYSSFCSSLAGVLLLSFELLRNSLSTNFSTKKKWTFQLEKTGQHFTFTAVQIDASKLSVQPDKNMEGMGWKKIEGLNLT